MLSNMFPVDVTSSRSRVSEDSYYPLPPPPRPPPPRSCYHSSLTSKALVLVSSGVFTSSTLSNIFPVDVASSRSRVSKDNYYPLPLSPPHPQGLAIVHPLTSNALVLVSSRVCTSSTLSNMFPVDVASSRSRVSSRSFSSFLFSLTEKNANTSLEFCSLLVRGGPFDV